MAIQPIETRYKGHRFRSRLEARWAVFFDALDVRWEYEAQGYGLPSGLYLPDFQLFGLGGDAANVDYCWFEVKPDLSASSAQLDTQSREDPRWNELVDATKTPLIAAFGMPHLDDDMAWGANHCNGWMELYAGEYWDNGRTFATCPSCGRVGIVFEGRGSRVCGHRPNGDDKLRTDEDPLIMRAYTAARSARFEHGVSGA